MSNDALNDETRQELLRLRRSHRGAATITNNQLTVAKGLVANGVKDTLHAVMIKLAPKLIAKHTTLADMADAWLRRGTRLSQDECFDIRDRLIALQATYAALAEETKELEKRDA